MSEPKFSVVLIAKNEEKTLPRLLNSLREFRDRGGEIILVDTGSTDKTMEIAREAGCFVHNAGLIFRKYIDDNSIKMINSLYVRGNDAPIVEKGDSLFDYSMARNYAASLAKNDMVAMPDCDEEYTKFDIDALNNEIEAGCDQLEYNFVYAHDAEGNEAVKFLHCKFYNRKKLNWVNIIHEVLAPIDGAEEAQRKFLPESVIKLEHYQNHETNRGHYLKGLAYDFFLNPLNDRNAHYFGRELMYTGRFQSAIAQLEKHIEMNKWPAERSQSMIFIGDCLSVLGKPLEAVLWYTKALDVCADRREPLMRLAETYFKQGKAAQTMIYAAAATQIKGDNYYANFAPYYENLPHELLYWAYWQLGDKNASLRHFQICQGYKPFEPKYLHDMRWYMDLPVVAFLVPTLGRPEGLKRCLESIKNLDYPQEKIHVLVSSDGEKVSQEIKDLYPNFTFRAHNERQGVPKNVKSMVQRFVDDVDDRGVRFFDCIDYFLYASNDIEFHPLSLISAIKTAQDNGKLFMSFNTQGEKGVLPDNGNICEHFMIHRSLVKKLNYEIFDTDFYHVGVDNLLWAKMEKINHSMWCKRAVVNHYHFSQTGKEMDDVYKLAWKKEMVEKDRALLQKKLEELHNKPFNEI